MTTTTRTGGTPFVVGLGGTLRAELVDRAGLALLPGIRRTPGWAHQVLQRRRAGPADVRARDLKRTRRRCEFVSALRDADAVIIGSPATTARFRVVERLDYIEDLREDPARLPRQRTVGLHRLRLRWRRQSARSASCAASDYVPVPGPPTGRRDSGLVRANPDDARRTSSTTASRAARRARVLSSLHAVPHRNSVTRRGRRFLSIRLDNQLCRGGTVVRSSFTAANIEIGARSSARNAPSPRWPTLPCASLRHARLRRSGQGHRPDDGRGMRVRHVAGFCRRSISAPRTSSSNWMRFRSTCS